MQLSVFSVVNLQRESQLDFLRSLRRGTMSPMRMPTITTPAPRTNHSRSLRSFSPIFSCCTVCSSALQAQVLLFQAFVVAFQRERAAGGFADLRQFLFELTIAVFQTFLLLTDGVVLLFKGVALFFELLVFDFQRGELALQIVQLFARAGHAH